MDTLNTDGSYLVNYLSFLLSIDVSFYPFFAPWWPNNWISYKYNHPIYLLLCHPSSSHQYSSEIPSIILELSEASETFRNRFNLRGVLSFRNLNNIHYLKLKAALSGIHQKHAIASNLTKWDIRKQYFIISSFEKEIFILFLYSF